MLTTMLSILLKKKASFGDFVICRFASADLLKIEKTDLLLKMETNLIQDVPTCLKSRPPAWNQDLPAEYHTNILFPINWTFSLNHRKSQIHDLRWFVLIYQIMVLTILGKSSNHKKNDFINSLTKRWKNGGEKLK